MMFVKSYLISMKIIYGFENFNFSLKKLVLLKSSVIANELFSNLWNANKDYNDPGML